LETVKTLKNNKLTENKKLSGKRGIEQQTLWPSDREKAVLTAAHAPATMN
jgi:hypothetical protein